MSEPDVSSEPSVAMPVAESSVDAQRSEPILLMLGLQWRPV